jgi:hypothetical protein
LATTEVIPATEAHALELARTMHPATAALEAELGLTPGEAVIRSMGASEASFAVLAGGELLAIFGVAQHPGTPPGTLGNVWVMASSAVDRHRIEFIRAGRAAVGVLLRLYPVLVGFADVRHEGMVRFARWLGFEVKEPRPHGAAGKPSHLIFLRRREWL